MSNCDQLTLLTCEEMARADKAASNQGVSGLELMEKAGRSVADVAMDMAPFGSCIVVLCGPGNNGGDGFVAARYLQERGRSVVLGLLGDANQLRDDAFEMAHRFQGKVHAMSSKLLDGAGLVVDALFGAGLSRAIDEQSDLAKLFSEIRRRQIPVLAVDVPSGLHGDLGRADGEVLPARRTVTFFRRKPGHLLQPGRELCGDVIVADIGMPPDVLQVSDVLERERQLWANAPALWFGLLPNLVAADHKYRRGHALVVSGATEMSGAARLAARAALRIGAGLVTVAAPEKTLIPHAAQLNAILLARAESGEDVRQLLTDRRKNTVVLGPGLGLDDSQSAKLMAALNSEASVVLDADALTLSAGLSADVFESIGRTPARPVVLTPHEGEFSRLFPEIRGCKLGRCRSASVQSGAIVVLKGADTVVAAPDGRAVINENAPPWLATAGSGDVLAGMIGGLLAQGMPGFEAACAAVWLHGAAGAAYGRGLIAEDVVELLPSVLQETAMRM